jgi:membrane fusion protein (multidrug efflux system)
MDVKVDVSNTDGKMLADATTRRGASAETRVFDRVDQQADEAVRRIIAANMGRSAAQAASPAAPVPTPAAAASSRAPAVASAPVARQRSTSTSAAPAGDVVARAR